MRSGNLQSDVAHQFFELISGHGALLAGTHLDQHADFSPGVDVSRHHSMTAHLQPMMARNLYVFTQFGDLSGTERLQVGLWLGRERPRDFIAEGAKTFVA